MEKKMWIIIGVLLIISVALVFVIFNFVDIGDNTKNKDKSGNDSLNFKCNSDYYNCEDFETYGEALIIYDFCGGKDNDIHQLDNDGDGEPCEGLKGS